MSGSDTANLLSILRGTAPPPQPPPGTARPPSTTGARPSGDLQRAPSAGSMSLYHTAPPTPAPPASHLDALLAAFARPHPSTAVPPPQPQPQPQGAQSSTQGGSYGDVSHQQPPSRPSLAPTTRRSSDLLALFQGTSTSPAQQHPASSPHSRGDDRVVSPTSPPGGNARQLLGLLMGDGAASSPAPSTAANETQLPLGPSPSAPPADVKRGPDFGFVSPFDVFARTPVPPDTVGSISPGAHNPLKAPLSSVPLHIRAQSATSGSDTSETQAAPAPQSETATSPLDSPITHAHLAAQYLPALASSVARRPAWAPLGLRLPRSAHPPHEPQHLSISLSEAHAESLAPAFPPTTPITLLPLSATFPGARRAAGIWEHGIAYATGGGKGRVRVIDRESGARVLLKGSKNGDVKELRVAPHAVHGKRRIATVTEEGVAAVWEVADSFGSEEEAAPRRLRELNLPSGSVALVRFDPASASQTLALVGTDSTVHLIALDGSRKPRQLAVDGEVVDAAYSAYGEAFAVVTRDGRYTLYATDATDSFDVVSTGTAPLPEGAEADQLAVLGQAQGGVSAHALAISSRQGTHITLIVLADSGSSASADPTVIAFTAPPGTQDLWGQLAYHPPTQSLLVSHALRGSLYAFRLAFPSSTSSAGVRIDHVLEHPTPDPLISFVLDALPSADPHASIADTSSPAQVAYGALILHPRGLSHLGLVANPPPPSASASPSTAGSDDEPDLAALAGRRMSLEGSIYVSSEVSVQVDEPETDELSRKVALASPSPSPPASAPQLPQIDEPATGDLGNGIAVARTPVAEQHGADGIRLAGPVVNAAIRSMKARQAAASPFPSLSDTTSADREREKEGETVLRELRRIEAVLPGKIGRAVSRELDKHVSHLEDHTASSAAASSSRDDALQALVQQTVTSSVAHALEGAFANQVGNVVERAVRAQMGRGVEEAIARALPLELEKQLNRPGLALTLSSSIATTIAPPLERHLTNTLIKSVAPALEQTLAGAVEGVIGSIRMEMVNVRKEVVQEQSGAVSILEDEVASLREEVSTLKAMMEQMHALVLQQAEPRTPAAAISPRVPHQPLALAPQQRNVVQPFASVASPPQPTHPLRQSQPASAGLGVGHTLPPIPRTATPPERYEELFTEVMQPQHEPSFTALVHLIASSPLSRLDAVFPPPPALPKISMAVVLSLAYRLSQLVAEREGPLDEEGKKQLLWLRKAIAACDGKQPPELLALIPRILTNVIDNLVLRGHSLVAARDAAGANDVRLVQQYAHARLTLFAQTGAGEGFEVFRR